MPVNKVLMYIDMMQHGGAQRVMANLANHFAANGVHVVLINDFKLKEGETEYPLDDKIKRYYLQKNIEGNKIYNNIIRISRIRKIITKEKPEIILSFLGRPNIRMLIATLGMKTKKIVSVRNDPNKEYGSSSLRRTIAGVLFKNADYIVFQTQEAMSYFPTSVQAKGVIILNPVGEQFYNIQRSEDVKNIISIGRLEPQKNNALLINAFSKITKKFPDENLVFYGEGSLKDSLKLLSDRLGISDKVIFAGDTDDVPDKLAKCKIFVLSSDYEGLPNALMEALAAGVPCISTDCPCGGPKELINEGVNGFLVPVGDINKMSIALEQLLLDKTKRKNFSVAGKKKAEIFRDMNIYKSWEVLFDEIMRKNQK